MNGYFLVVAAAGNPAGGILAGTFRASERTLSLALHFAVGIVLAVVGLELMPKHSGHHAVGADVVGGSRDWPRRKLPP